MARIEGMKAMIVPPSRSIVTHLLVATPLESDLRTIYQRHSCLTSPSDMANKTCFSYKWFHNNQEIFNRQHKKLMPTLNSSFKGGDSNCHGRSGGTFYVNEIRKIHSNQLKTLPYNNYWRSNHKDHRENCKRVEIWPGKGKANKCV